jgi:restriction endonuclease S subunit
VLQQTHTSAQPKLALTRLGEVKFPLPSISIQKEKIDKIKSIQKYKNSLTDIAKKNIEHFKNFKLKFLSEKLNGEIA